MHYDVGIIGGGVIGLSCAWRLAQSGARVAVFEKGRVGREASWAAAGMLAPQCEMAQHAPAGPNEAAGAAMFGLCLRGRTMYAQFADELFDVTGIDIELSLSTHKRGDWRTPGIMHVATGEDNSAPQAFSMQRASGLSVEAAPDFHGSTATWLPEEGQVNNRKLAEALFVAAQKSGVDIYEEADATFWAQEVAGESNDFVMCKPQMATFSGSHKTPGSQDITFDKALFCAGAWPPRIEGAVSTSRSGENFWPVAPVAGQIIALRGNHRLEHVVYSPDAYLVPRRNGQLLVGATVENVGFQKRATAGGALQLLKNAMQLFPGIADLTIVDHWAGLRPSTPDRLPIMGRLAPNMPDFFVASGHFRNGILLAPVTAQLMADCILRDTQPPTEFGIQRFATEAICASA